ncbi:hypothetical protein [Tychonema sp. LEGE 06208]|uniref:hypothetical protein n=1 Tax=Tychonema sp. LEGE 06208 TaxID=1828663 RepID=UPI00187E73A3|nr:hypothetical protein [Tychonema sp. LEGE 06208]MBE9163936.1 hypothetical protein [Tychonema sp. LEGE 06208]
MPHSTSYQSTEQKGYICHKNTKPAKNDKIRLDAVLRLPSVAADRPDRKISKQNWQLPIATRRRKLKGNKCKK